MTDDKELELFLQQAPLDLDNPTVKATLKLLKETGNDPERREQILRRAVASSFNLSTPEEIDQKLSDLRKEKPASRRGLIPGLVFYDDLGFIHQPGAGENLSPTPTLFDPGRLYMAGKNISPAPKTEEDPEGVDLFPNPALLQGMNELAKDFRRLEARRLQLPPDFSELGKQLTNVEMSNRRGEMHFIDSLSEYKNDPRPVNEETLMITFVQGGKSKATWRGKTLEERNTGDWTVASRMQVIRVALIAAWRSKFKEKMPINLALTISTEGHFSFGGGPFSRTVAPKVPTGKHSGGKAQKRNKAKRRK